MSRFWSQSRQTVRPRSSGRVPLLLCLLAFCATAMVVYHWGRERRSAANPRPTYTATAYVKAGETRIPVAYTGEDPRQAAEVANALAERYASNRRAQWRDQTQGPCLKARQAAESTRRDYTEGTARLAALERQVREAAEAAARAKPMIEAPHPAPPMIGNPQWQDLQRQFAELQRRREQLLVDRTPLHPAVQEIDVHISDVQEQLAAVPRQIRNPQAKTAWTTEMAAVNTGSPADDRAERQAATRIAEENQQKLNDLTAAVQRSRQACDEAELAEKQAAEQVQAGPQLAVQYAQAARQNLPAVDHDASRLIWSTLVASALMAFGIGMVWLGASIEPPVANVAEVEAALGGPIIGTIPSDDPLADPTAPERQAQMRRRAIGIGLLLIAACPLAAIWGVIGM